MDAHRYIVLDRGEAEGEAGGEAEEKEGQVRRGKKEQSEKRRHRKKVNERENLNPGPQTETLCGGGEGGGTEEDKQRRRRREGGGAEEGEHSVWARSPRSLPPSGSSSLPL